MLFLYSRAYPEEIREHASTVLSYLTRQMAEQMDSKTRQADMTVVEGCLLGLKDYLSAFGLPEEDEPKEVIYDKLIRLSLPPSSTEGHRTTFRCSVDVFSEHCGLFSQFVVGNVRFWFKILKQWAFSRNRDDHKTGWRAMLAFYRCSSMYYSTVRYVVQPTICIRLSTEQLNTFC